MILERTPLADPAGEFADRLATLELTAVDGTTAVTRAKASTNMKLMLPQTKRPVARVFLSTYGGGLLPGDEIDLSVRLRPHAQCILTTQASTKVYKNPDGLPCRQSMDVVIEENAKLAWVPDPITCYADARYDQLQRFQVQPGGSLMAIDWLTSGRRARGEVWALEHYCARQQVFFDRHQIVEDALRLNRDDGPIAAQFRAGRFHCFAVLLLIGDQYEAACEQLCQLPRNADVLPRDGSLMLLASRVAHGAVLKILSETTDAVQQLLMNTIAPMIDFFEEPLWSGKY